MMEAALLRSKNISATEFYYDIIAEALKQKYALIYDEFEGSKLPRQKDILIVCGSCTEMLRLWLKGYRKIVTWYQGTLPEESYMRNQSSIRYRILSSIEKFALQHSVLNICVSQAMVVYYEKKYGISIKQRSYVMPCFNVEFQKQSFKNKDSNSRVFTYAGGLSQWQCIEQMLSLYKRIESQVDGNAKLLFFTPEIDTAKKLVKKWDIINCEVNCVHYSQLAEAMLPAKFGFALREDTVVNRVATPTKLANYVANGIIPIYSECIDDFYKESVHNSYQVSIHDVNHISDDEVKKIITLLDQRIATNNLQQQMRSYFEKYYNAEWHIQHLSNELGDIL